MKQSLWDLKQRIVDETPYVSDDYEAIPMGFETQARGGRYVRHEIMKQSLWDLKLNDSGGGCIYYLL